MAIELCSDSSVVSPRISFSYDLCLSDNVPVEPRPLPSNSSASSIDFDFCVRQISFDQESSPADELFSEGKILPTEIKKKPAPTKSKDQSSTSTPLLPPSSLRNDSSSGDGSSKRETLKKETKSGCDEAAEKQSGSRSFWGFKRSSSLNCGSGYGRSFCPLPLLSRSNSTGSTPGVKRTPLSKDSNGVNHKQRKQSSSSKSSSQSTASVSYHQKPPLKKNYGNGVRVNPVLNVASGNLFCLSSVFSNAKDKNKKKLSDV